LVQFLNELITAGNQEPAEEEEEEEIVEDSSDDSAYAASKSGLIRLVESLSEEVKELNININRIMPSTIYTEANRIAMPEQTIVNG
jgi:NAD(P)-dependent dehydrogenase (short-subunit alcohol dehydrogenase family)